MRGEKAWREKRENARLPDREPQISAGRILVVEDDPAVRASLELLLRRRYEVLALSSASGLLEMLDICDPDLVLLDAGLPGRDGFQACSELRGSRHRGVPVVFLTGRQDDGSFARFVSVGGDAYLRKPFDPDELLGAIERLLGSPR